MDDSADSGGSDRVRERAETIARHLVDGASPPGGVLMIAVLHFVPEEDEARRIIAGYMDGGAASSYLAISHTTADGVPEKKVQAILDVYENTTEEVVFGRGTRCSDYSTGSISNPSTREASQDGVLGRMGR